MKTRRIRRSFGFVVASEFTVAAHLLFLLPPKAQAAVLIPLASEESGESALAMLRIERTEPVPQEPVEVNKTVPQVEPPPAYPTFSPVPTDDELFRARVFGEPLIPEAGESNDAENQAMGQAITTYLYGGDSEALEPLEGVVTNFPQSRWRVAVQANVGSWYKKKGYFTRAQRNLLEAWRLGKNSKTEGVKRLAEFAAGELMLLHAQFGQVDPLEALVAEFAGRELSGGITEKLYVGQATVWGLRNDHQNAIPSGSVALERLRVDKHEKEENRKRDGDPSYRKKTFQRHPELDRFPPKHEGASLSEIQDLANLTDLSLRMAKRENPGAEIPLPALVHFKQGHFAALVEKRGERFRLDDPLLGGEVWLSREAFDEESSGFFLIGEGRIPQGWRGASAGEAEPIRGKCVYATGDPDNTRPNDQSGGGGGPGEGGGGPGGGGGGPGGGGPDGGGGPSGGGPDGGGPDGGGPDGGGPDGGGPDGGGPDGGGPDGGGPDGGGPDGGGPDGGGPDGGGPDGCSGGMAWYNFHLLRASLHVSDTPVGCSTPRGPSSYFNVSYNQREATQPQTFTFSNLGPRWNFGWLSYIEDDPTAVGEPVNLHRRGGGREPYQAFVDGTSAPQIDVRATLKIASTSPIVYERHLRNGSVEVFSQTDGAATAPRKVFLTQVKDSAGNALTFTYDGQLRLVSATDAVGRVTTVSYERASDPLKITKVTDPYDRSATFEYNDVGQLTKITDVIGLTSEFEYGVNLEYLSSTSDFIRALTTAYGTTTFRSGTGPYASVPVNRWVEATDPLGGTERVEHILNGTNPLPASEDPSDVPTGFTGNSNLNTHVSIYYSKLVMSRSTTDPPDPEDGKIVHFRSSSQFKVSGYQIQSIKRPLQNRVWYEHEGETTQNGVGPSGRASEKGRVLEDGTSQVFRYEYNQVGKPIRFTDPLGRERVFVYGTATAPDPDAATGTGIDLLEVRHENGGAYETLGQFTYNSDHRILTATDALGNTSTYTYNEEGQLLTATSPPTVSAPSGATSTFVYDEDGYLLSATGPVAGSTTTYGYDGFGRMDTISPPLEDPVSFDYDALDRLTQITFADDTYEEIVYNRLDAEKLRDRLGRWSNLRFDAMRRPVATTDPEGRTTSFQWCDCGVLDGLVDANGNRTSWEYDLQGRVTKEVRANAAEFVYTYEGATSRLETVTDPKSIVSTFEYYLDNRLKEKSYSDATPEVTFTYDYRGRLSTAANGTGTLSWTYDLKGRVLSESSTHNSSTVSYTYDEVGSRKTTSLNGAPFSAYSYDTALRLESITRGSKVFSFDYDVASRRTEMFYPNGIGTKYVYDIESRLERITAKMGSTVITDFQYGYNAVGNRTQKATPDFTESYEYDRASQLVEVRRTGTAANRWHYAYDQAGNRTTEQIGDNPASANYDNMNRLLSTSAGGALAFKGSLNEPGTVAIQEEPATVDNTNAFQGAVPSAPGTNTVTVVATDAANNTRTNTYEVEVSGDGTSYEYDENGNLVEKDDGTEIWTYDWNAENQLIEVSENETTVAAFEYDPLGRRVEKVAGATTTTFTYDGLDILREVAGATTTYYVHGPVIDEPLAKEISATTTYYHADALGSILKITDSTGDVTHEYRYDPFGRIELGASQGGYSFTGREWDSEVGLHFYRTRYYDPQTARFLSEDLIGLYGGPNLYTYVRNNSINRFDPLGMIDKWGRNGFIESALRDAAKEHLGETMSKETSQELRKEMTEQEYNRLGDGKTTDQEKIDIMRDMAERVIEGPKAPDQVKQELERLREKVNEKFPRKEGCP